MGGGVDVVWRHVRMLVVGGPTFGSAASKVAVDLPGNVTGGDTREHSSMYLALNVQL